MSGSIMEEKPWFKHYPTHTPKTIDYDKEINGRSIAEMFQSSVQRSPDAPYLYFTSLKWSYEQVWDQVVVVATALKELGVSSEDVIAINLPNTVQYVVTLFAAFYLGCKTTLLNPLHVAAEYLFQLNDTEATVLVCADFLYDTLYPVKSDTSLKVVVTTSVGDVLGKVKKFMGVKLGKIPKGTVKDPSAVTWGDLLKIGKGGEPPEIAKVDIAKTAVILYTGGTTGVPKGAELSHRNIIANVIQGQAWLNLSDKDIIMGVMPFFHSYGLVLQFLYATYFGGGLVVIPNPRDIKHILEQVQSIKASVFMGVPTLYIGILGAPEFTSYDLTSLKYCLSGAAPLPVELEQRWMAEGTEKRGLLLKGLGMTECSPLITASPMHDIRTGATGVPLPDTLLRTVDAETGEMLPLGSSGELVVQGPQVMKGYHNRPDETNLALKPIKGQPGLWMHTGDIGTVDEEGYLYLMDRKKDMIIVSGYKVFPSEVEGILQEHPAVKLSAVIGVVDERTTERVRAYVVVEDDQSVTQEELIAFCKERMAKYKVPREVEFRKELPTSMVGKVLRRELRESD